MCDIIDPLFAAQSQCDGLIWLFLQRGKLQQTVFAAPKNTSVPCAGLIQLNTISLLHFHVFEHVET